MERSVDYVDRLVREFVNKRSIPWPPESLRYLLSQAIRGYFRLEDRWHARRLAR